MSSSVPAKEGDIVLLKQGIGVIRYHGPVDFDEDFHYYGVELKGPSISGGHNGTINGKKYFETTGGDGRGIFIRQPIRVISSEEILEKLAEIYDILKGRKGHSHFIARATYDDLLTEHEQLKEELQDKQNELEDLNMDNSILKEQIAMMKGTLGDKLDETAQMNDKIIRAEKKLGSRLSQIDLSSVKQQLESESSTTQQPMEIPDYSQSTQVKKGHRKQRSSTTIALDSLEDGFGDIAKDVQSYGSKDAVSGPMHYRKFSNTTRQILDQHRAAGQNVGQIGIIGNGQNGIKKGHRARGSMKIGDIVDEDGIEYESDEQQHRLERDSNDEDDELPIRKGRSHASRESRQLDDEELNHNDYFNDEAEVNERESAEEDEDQDQEPEQTKRKPKSRGSRDSRVLEDVEVSYGGHDNDPPPQSNTRTRGSRDSRQLDDEEVAAVNEDNDNNDNNEDEDEEDGLGDVQMETKQKHNKARDSYQIPTPALSAAVLETHNEHHMEAEAAEINGPKDTHRKTLSMTSDSSAYKAFMSVD